MPLPALRMIPWDALRVARETGFAPLPGQEQAWLIRRVLLPGRFFRIAGPDDDRFVEIEAGAEIPVGPDGQTPAGAFAIVFDNRGRQTDRTIELQGRGAPPRPQDRQGEFP